ncbi:hypothetical protein [Microbacterium sp. SORGH_AS_0888]|uniref:hypothetical protein n=1 Tax=Microbacterium sp. SORGH_AS_0888 TaxID=3041791 RepID=UPI0027896784|nr:hypothetical protein [Microbacterium sp. SORGH_AS_0888]MDQ1130669.1 Arc/MetJ-type ribon-helix-helix transcriptional regulator [Microbacterium sp. SORGH_AS_0888]
MEDTTQIRSMLRAITDHPDDATARLRALREIVAARLDATDSARETGTLARVMLDIEAALRSLDGAGAAVSSVDELLKRRAARGAK